ncbi:cubilin-like isoform X2 [Tachypleus tridentatus]|uniref:cubilin-like isoform X2 n=1 Tax=Tachypleus tridentatus TaxID=6853 RepID=UPI003FD66EBE
MIQLKQVPNSCSDEDVRRTGGRDCDQHIQEFIGRITTPNFPGRYGPNQECVFSIQRADSHICQVELEFRVFDLEPSWGRCDKDFLELPNSSRLCNGRHKQIQRLDFPHDKNVLTLKFVSDSNGSGTGFDIVVRQLQEFCRLPAVPPSRKRCDQEVATVSGSLLSPGFPNDYGPNEKCIFSIRRAEPTVCSVVLDIRNFDVESSIGGCTKDYLEFPDLTRLCGTYKGKKIIDIPRGLDSVKLQFVSDRSGSSKGFEIYVDQMVDSCGGSSSSGKCDQEITSYKGIFSSPSYPNDYSANQRCTYTLRKADSSVCVVELDFHQFDIEFSRDKCSRDFLELPDGTRLCGMISGSRLVEFPVGSDSATFTFYSDNYGSGRGFEISVVQRKSSCGSVPTDCDQEVTDISGRFSSPSFPRIYSPGLHCRYIIRRPDPSICKVDIAFRTLDIEYSAFCVKDYFELSNEERICGNNLPGLKTLEYNPASGGVMTLQFVTDSYGSGKGFDVDVHQLPNSCKTLPSSVQCNQVITGEKDNIRTPNYPDDYPPDAKCEYEIRRLTLSTCQVQLEFLDFDVEADEGCKADFLEIESTEERLCGYNQQPIKVIPFRTGFESLRLVFISDKFTSRRGFNIRVTQLPGSCYKAVGDSSTCDTLSDVSGVMQTFNYPASYNSNTDCSYKVFRHSSAICRLEIYFSRFDVGQAESGTCGGDYLEIDGSRYCGILDGQTVHVPFPKTENEIDFLFRTDGTDQKSSFRLEVKQLSQGCDEDVSSKDCDATYTKETFQIISPGYTNRAYPSNINCKYTVKKSTFDVCAIEIKFNAFRLEESGDCTKDYLQIGDVKLCGKLPYDSVHTYQFPADELLITLHTDTYANYAGFFLTGRQVSC